VTLVRLRYFMDKITEIEQARLDRIAQGPEEGMHAMVRVLAGVTLARKLLIALWRFTRTGELPEGVVLRASA
jgi:hypothetical protein